MSAFWGSLASVLIGLADLCAAKVTPRMAVMTLTGTAMLGGVIAAVLGLPLVESELRVDDLLLGAIGGVSMAAALAFYLKAMSVASISVTSPATAVQIALWPFAYDVVIDDARPSALAWLGVLVALASLFFTTWSPESKGRILAGLERLRAVGQLAGITWRRGGRGWAPCAGTATGRASPRPARAPRWARRDRSRRRARPRASRASRLVNSPRRSCG